MKFKYVGEHEVFFCEGKTVIVNKANGTWMRLSKDIYDTMNEMVENNFDDTELEFCDEEDKNFFQSVIEKLRDCKIIAKQEDEVLFQNKIAGIELTHRCNLRCIHCCIDAENVLTDNNDLKYENMISLLKKLIKWNPASIMLSGGEPTFRKDFFEIAKFLRTNYSGCIILSTNGILINKNNVGSLVNLVDKIDMSVDGYDEESCSKIRGKGVFQKVMEAVRLLKEADFDNITLSIATADRNEHWEKKFVELNEKLGTSPILRLFSPVGRGVDSKDFFTEKTDQEVYIPNDYLHEKEERVTSSCSCAAGTREIFVNYKGDIFPCSHFSAEEYKLGNILTCKSVSEITKPYDSIETILRVLQENGIRDERCKQCSVRTFCWTCPGSVEQIKTKEAFEAQCSILYPLLHKRVWED